MIGKTLGHYEVLAHIGSGGMGEVYRARDTKLGREVALKVLPAAFAGDPERLARFEREATTLAKLQHANVATIYGFERDVEPPFLVMELVEGEDLSERLQRGPLPPTEALLVAAQVAEGLEAAHALGIVHRDLKPANIKLTPAGDVKLLDFGLARAYSDEPDASSTLEISNSPTVTAAMTGAGVILGTAAYMSPEQARGKRTDRQADVWAFGVVLFEMLTGQRLFGGETVSDSIGAILHRDPDLDLLPPGPPHVRRLLRRCLARDKRQRLRDIGDARLEIADAIAAGTARADDDDGGRRAGRAGWLAAGVLAVAAVAAGWWGLTRDTGPGLTEFTVGLPRAEALRIDAGAWPQLQFTPDGRSLLHSGGPDFQLFLRPLAGFAATPVAGVRDVGLFTFSPDGQWIAYTAGSKLWKVAVSGGAPIALCDTDDGPGLVWGDGELYFARGNGGGLWAVSTDGGEPRPISQLDDAREETSHRWPHLLPDGRHLLLTIKTARIATFDDALIGVLDLDTGEVRVLLEGGMQPRYLPSGHLVYGRGNQLLAVPFDADELAIRGTPVPVLDDVISIQVNGGIQAAFGPGGELAYVPVDGPLVNNQLIWLHTSGRITPLPIDDPRFYNVDISPDGTMLAGMRSAANDEIHLYDLVRGIRTRLTRTPGNDDMPLWSPDGEFVAYNNDRDGDEDLFLVPVDGSAPPRRLLDSDEDDYPETWTPDGTTLLFTRVEADGSAALWRVRVDGSVEAEPIFADDVNRGWAHLSPDGRLLAYVSDSSGDGEVYVCRYPELSGNVRVSTLGGVAPTWAPDGRMLYYAGERVMMGAVITAGGAGRFAAAVGRPDTVLTLDENVFGPFALAPDGKRFLGGRFPTGSNRYSGIRVVLDWADRLRGVVP